MNLQQLMDKGGIVRDAAHRLPAVWKRLDENGAEVVEQFTVGVRQLSYAEVQRIFGKTAGDQDRGALAIAECILLGEDGTERLSYEQALLLHPGLVQVFTELINRTIPTAPKA